MSATASSLLFGGLTAVAWYVLIAGYALVTRPRGLPPGPPVPDFGPEPPAVVNLLVSRCELTSDAADATLLDLAARRIIELHQPGTDPADLLVRVRGPEPPDLLPYERRVLRRVRDLAGDRLTPLREISGRYAEGGPRWLRHLRTEVIGDAQRRGLVRARRANPGIMLITLVAAMTVSCSVAIPFSRNDSGAGAGITNIAVIVGGGLGVILVAMIMIVILATLLRAPTHTRIGRAVGSRWVGFGRWLDGYDSLADLPPAAVTVWDRYLAYGVALGVNPVAGRALDLRAGRTITLLSRAHGTVRPVRVRYPRDPMAYSQAGVRLTWSLGVLAGWTAFWVFAAPRIGDWPALARWPLYVLGVAAPIRALYKIVRAVVDKVAPVTVSGTVLAIDPYRFDENGLILFAQLVLDDGKSTSVRPWLVRTDRIVGLSTGDHVTVEAQRWTGYVTAVARAEVSSSGPDAGSTAS